MSDSLNNLKRHLAIQVAEKSRSEDFDIDDKPEAAVVAPFIMLKMALDELDRKIGTKWHNANLEAVHRQRIHRRWATVAIVAGLSAVFLVLIQLGLQLTNEGLVSVAKYLELVAVVVATFAAVLGIAIKSDTKWFVQRHIAERLRALRFRALGRPDLWCAKPGDWGQWIDREVATILKVRTLKDVKNWAATLHASPEEAPPVSCTPDPAEIRALGCYYLHKRVIHQANYFNAKCADASHQDDHHSTFRQFLHRHHGLALFLTSVIMVAVHIFAETRIHHGSAPHVAAHEKTASKPLDLQEAEHSLSKVNADVARLPHLQALIDPLPPGQSAWKIIAVWSLVLAGAVPLASFGIKVWKSAFEPARSEALCLAKESSLRREAIILDSQEITFAQLLENISDVEHFFAHEHAEWLRLMLETDWMP